MLVDPCDIGDIAAALMRVTGDTTLRRALRQRGLARAAALDWRACAAGYLALYRSVLAESAPLTARSPEAEAAPQPAPVRLMR